MDGMDMTAFPFVELYGHASGNPKIVPGVPVTKWKNDAKALRCGICTKKFSFLRRRHHCRACGDVCCRRCLGFCLVDIPQLGVDLAYTCALCIRRHTHGTPSLTQELTQLAQSFDSPRSGDSHSFDHPRVENSSQRNKSRLVLSPAASEYGSPRSSAPSSPCSVASLMSPCCSPRAGSDGGSWDADYKVVVSQYNNQKLHSVCSLLSDYLECKGGAIVLADDDHVWVLGHKGLRTSVLHSDMFLSICHRAIQSNECFSISKRRRAPPSQQTQQTQSPKQQPSHSALRYFAAAPILLAGTNTKPIGCIVALDTKSRDDSAAQKVQKTLANLAHLVMNLLVEEKQVLRLYASGDFRIFAANALDLAPSSASPFERFGVAPSPRSLASVSAAPMSTMSMSAAAAASTAPRSSSVRATRSRSLTSGDDMSFFERYAETLGLGSPMHRKGPGGKNRKHAASNPGLAKHARAAAKTAESPSAATTRSPSSTTAAAPSYWVA